MLTICGRVYLELKVTSASTRAPQGHPSDRPYPYRQGHSSRGDSSQAGTDPAVSGLKALKNMKVNLSECHFSPSHFLSNSDKIQIHV